MSGIKAFMGAIAPVDDMALMLRKVSSDQANPVILTHATVNEGKT